MTEVRVGNNYGPLQKDLTFDLPSLGYITYVGQNNVGKSALLQYIFCNLMNGQVKPDEICFFPKTRDYIETDITPKNSLSKFNNALRDGIAAAPMASVGPGANWEHLFSILMNEEDLFHQMGAITHSLKDDFGSYLVGARQSHTLNGVSLPKHGSGVRNLLPVIAAIVNPKIKVILIDEPEASLEPVLQKKYRDIFLDACENQGKRVIVCTHSHLFLNKNDPDSNFVVQKIDDQVSIVPILSSNDLNDLTFRLLGNSLSDLSLPDNFVFLEGASDEVIFKKVASLIAPSNQIKTVSCGGAGKTKAMVECFERNMRPLTASDKNPYSKKLVVLLDKPNAELQKLADELNGLLDDRYFELEAESIEEYMPEDFYTKVGLKKDEEIAKIKAAKGNFAQESRLKKDLSIALEKQIEATDLDKIPLLVDAVKKALA